MLILSPYPANTKRWPSVGLMLGDHLHQPNINPILGRCFVFAEYRCNTPEYTPPPWNYTQVDSGISQYSGIYPGVDSILYPGVDPVALRIYPSIPEYTPLFVISVFESQNLPSLPEYTPLFNQIYMCDPPRIYPSLPEHTPLFNQFICATLPESTPPPS